MIKKIGAGTILLFSAVVLFSLTGITQKRTEEWVRVK